MAKTGVLLINLGTPDSPETSDVRKYLREFLMDGEVIDIPPFQRWMLVNLIIAPFRGPKSSVEYKKVWTDEGSPLLIYGEQVRDKLQAKMGGDFKVVLAMRYQNPSLRKGLEELKAAGVDRFVAIPLYPQYATATTRSTITKLEKEMQRWPNAPGYTVLDQFPSHPSFIRAFEEVGKRYMADKTYDHYLFSYHGVPERQILKADNNGVCKLSTCCDTYTEENKYCYRAQCFETTRALVEKLGIAKENYTVSFQSRLGKTPWIRPYTDDVVNELAAKGVKSVLAFSPSFIADCLETTIEVGEEYKEQFEEQGGEEWVLVESLNANDVWIDALQEMVEEQLQTA